MANLNYDVPGIVPAIAQPSSMACWATVATMMMSWRARQSMTIQDAMDKVGEPYASYFANNRGLPWAEHEAFGIQAGMTVEGLACYAPAGLYQLLLQYHSPLFVVIAPPTNNYSTTHILCVTGMSDDGTPNGLVIRFNDPDGGQRRTLTFDEFEREYEGAARPVMNAQVMHY